MAGEHRPIAALGVLSSAAYQSRRDLLRMTWLNRSDRVESILARFVIAVPNNVPIPEEAPVHRVRSRALSAPGVCPDMKRSSKDPVAAVLIEAARHGDVTLLHTNVSNSRVWSPLHSTWRWFLHATQHRPFSRAHFIVKMDDDASFIFRSLRRNFSRYSTAG
eukprot:6910628-Prymnesium_polylepis.2